MTYKSKNWKYATGKETKQRTQLEGEMRNLVGGGRAETVAVLQLGPIIRIKWPRTAQVRQTGESSPREVSNRVSFPDGAGKRNWASTWGCSQTPASWVHWCIFSTCKRIVKTTHAHRSTPTSKYSCWSDRRALPLWLLRTLTEKRVNLGYRALTCYTNYKVLPSQCP